MTEIEDPSERMEKLLASATALVRRRIIDAIGLIRNRFTLDEIADLLAAGQFDQALVNAELAALHIATGTTQAFVLSGSDTAKFLDQFFSLNVTFDQVNERAVRQMQLSQLRLVEEFTQGQRLATRAALVQGVAQGLNPRQQAMLFRNSIGLTEKQVNAVLNYRRLLESNSAAALTRELRDRRFDRTVTSAIASKEPLSATQIDRMVDRYSDRYLNFRATTIARTEALRSVHSGAHEMYLQAIEAGLLNEDELTRKWKTAEDERVRGSHSFMNGQARAVSDSFLSGDGNNLIYPGDFTAPPSDVIQCRCVLTTRFTIDS